MQTHLQQFCHLLVIAIGIGMVIFQHVGEMLFMTVCRRKALQSPMYEIMQCFRTDIRGYLAVHELTQ